MSFRETTGKVRSADIRGEYEKQLNDLSTRLSIAEENERRVLIYLYNNVVLFYNKTIKSGYKLNQI